MPFDILITGFYHFQGRDPRELVSESFNARCSRCFHHGQDPLTRFIIR